MNTLDEFEQIMTGMLLLLRNELILNHGILTTYSDTHRPIFKGIEQLIKPLILRLNSDDWSRLTKLTDLPEPEDWYEAKCICGNCNASARPILTYYCPDCNDDLTTWSTIINHINLSIWYTAGGSIFKLHQSWFDKWTYMGIQ